jgi:hypothetical protein
MRSRFTRLALFAAMAALAACAGEPTAPSTARLASPPRAVTLEPYAGKIRVGIVPEAASVKIGATVGYDVREKTTNAYLVSGLANELVTVTWNSGYPVATNNRRLQVVCTTSTTDRDQRVAAGVAAGFPSAWEFVSASSCWRVYIGERPLPIDATAEATYKQSVIDAGLATTAALCHHQDHGHRGQLA